MSQGFLDRHIFNPEADPPDDEPIFDGLLSKPDLAVWVGREKHRKSNVALQLAICAATGRDFLNFKFASPEPLKVVIVDYESKNAKGKFPRRYEAICRALNLTQPEREMLKANLKVILVRELYKAGRDFPRFPVKPTKDKKADARAEQHWAQFAKDYPADLYVFDPMRSLHAEQENDSLIEALLSRLRQSFPNAALVVLHHMSKPDGEHMVSLRDDMRRFSDGARGSTATKASADVIMCQERTMQEDTETVYFGAFMREGADVDPIPLVETDHESFCWRPTASVPDHLRDSFEALRRVGRPFRQKKEAVEAIAASTGKPVKTAYRHVADLMNRGLLARRDGLIVVSDSVDKATGPEAASVRI
jgi:hypothetical protein